MSNENFLLDNRFRGKLSRTLYCSKVCIPFILDEAVCTTARDRRRKKYLSSLVFHLTCIQIPTDDNTQVWHVSMI